MIDGLADDGAAAAHEQAIAAHADSNADPADLAQVVTLRRRAL